MDGELFKYGMGGISAVGLGMFTWAMRAIGKVETKVSQVEAKDSAERSEIWKRIDEINDNRVTREDVIAVRQRQDETLDELRVMRGQFLDVSKQLGTLMGRIGGGNGHSG